ncbi:hypothetical protein D3C80_1716480 [compost metagenome]
MPPVVLKFHNRIRKIVQVLILKLGAQLSEDLSQEASMRYNQHTLPRPLLLPLLNGLHTPRTHSHIRLNPICSLSPILSPA